MSYCKETETVILLIEPNWNKYDETKALKRKTQTKIVQKAVKYLKFEDTL